MSTGGAAGQVSQLQLNRMEEEGMRFRQDSKRTFRTRMGRASFALVPALALVTMAVVSTPTAAQASPRHVADWTQLHPADPPAARGGFGIASDPASHTVVLFGGFIGP